MNPRRRRTTTVQRLSTLLMSCALAAAGWQCGAIRAPSPAPATTGEPSTAATTAALDEPGPLQQATEPQATSQLVSGAIPLLSADMTEVDLAEVISPPAVLLYFSTSCPHCWNVAGEFQESCDRLVAQGYQCAGVVSSSSRLSAAREFAAETGLTCNLYLDYAGRFRTTYEMLATPTALVFDDRGEIVLRADPYYRGASLEIEMALAEQAGNSKDTVWREGVYYGARPCSTCHDVAYNSWLLSPHSLAIMHLGDRYEDPQCQRCHATAVGEPGGFSSLTVTGHLRDVGCEACHGAAGGHGPEGLRADRVQPQQRCAGCHDEQHTLSTDFEALSAVLDHNLAGTLPREQWNARRLELEEGRHPHLGTAIPAGSAVGSKACQGCHAEEFAAWSAGPHQGALATLKEQHSHKDEACLACHVPPEPYAETKGLRSRETGVGCEVCHGPGAEHAASENGSVPPPGLRNDHALECVVEPVCRRCHTTLRDPDWDLATRMAGIHSAAPQE